VGSALSLLVTEDFAFKTGHLKPLLVFYIFYSQSDGEVLYGIDVLLIHNIEAYD
jgi:hypothetical protein